MIVEAFKETLEKGLKENGQVVVSIFCVPLSRSRELGHRYRFNITSR